ncbi:MAG: aminotransferase class III-fold pyridoxal phosphate-dependent enzyme [Pirellulales bacterium]
MRRVQELFRWTYLRGQPTRCGGIIATLDIFEQEKTLMQVNEKAQFLAECLKPLKDHPFVGDIRQKGLVAAVELVENKPHKTPFPWSEKRGILACKAALEKEVWLRPLGNVIPLIPPLSITSDEIRLMVDALAFGIDRATQSRIAF